MDYKQLQAMIDHFSGQVGAQLSHYGPQAWAMMCLVKRADCIGNLVTSGVGMLLAILGGFAAIKAFAFCQAGMKRAAFDDEPPFIAGMVGSGILLVVAAIFCVVALVNLLDQWNWIGAFYPNVAVAHDIIAKVTAH